MTTILQRFGLHPLVAFAVICIDLMLFGDDALLGPIGWGISCIVGAALTIPCILMQRFSYRDSWGSAIAKGLIVGILTAIPMPLPSIITGTGGGILGVIATARGMLNKKAEKFVEKS